MPKKENVVGEAVLLIAEKKTLVFNIPNFSNLADFDYSTPKLGCFGFHWRLHIFPRGEVIVRNKEHVSFFLLCVEGRERDSPVLPVSFARQFHINSIILDAAGEDMLSAQR